MSDHLTPESCFMLCWSMRVEPWQVCAVGTAAHAAKHLRGLVWSRPWHLTMSTDTLTQQRDLDYHGA
jgi:hypothetical protein